MMLLYITLIVKMCSQMDSLQELSLMKEFKMVHLNIRSLVHIIDLLNLTLVETNLDIICLTETWLKPDVDSYFELIFD